MKIRNIMNNFLGRFDTKKISFIAVIFLLISMIPIWYLAFYARPSGDDYGYSMFTRQTWLQTHSLIEVIKTGLETTKSMCNTWNGDWFTVFIFTLMPEVFVTYSFWIVPISMTLLVMLGTICLAHEILVKRLGFEWYESLIAASIVLMASYQYIPSTAIGMYWYVGVIHYMLPHVVALFLLTFLSKYERTGKMRYIIYSAIGTVMTGGSSYFSTLLVFLIYAVVMILCVKNFRKILLLLIPLLTGGIALYFQITAPGNAKRGGVGFGFSLKRVMETIVESFAKSIVSIGGYLKDKTFIFIMFFILAIVIWECLRKMKSRAKFKWPGLFVAIAYCIYAAMYAPELYAQVEVSLGPATMEYFTFMLGMVASIIYVEGWLCNRLQNRKFDEIRYTKTVLAPAVILCCILVVLLRGNICETVFYRSCDYIISGQAEDFREQIASQMDILLDDSVKEAYLCPINDQQGPLMHMPVTEDPNAFTNRVVAGFYGKDKVVMVNE